MILSFGDAGAQFRINVDNLTEQQVGNLPDTRPEDLASTYNQLNASLIYNSFTVGLRGEFFNSSYSQNGYKTFPLTQRYVHWQGGPFEVTAGNFYGILGRGLTFRAFELTGVINEDFVFRRRYALSRDTDGVLVRSTIGRIEFTALQGRPLMVDFPPGNSDLQQRGEEVKGGETKLHLTSSSYVGGTYLSMHNLKVDLSSAYAGFDFNPLTKRLGYESLYMDIYGEYALANGEFSNLWSFNKNHSYSAYLTSNILVGNLGLSAEFKDYYNYLFRVNDPPSLIREHSWILLNRSTHVLLTTGERGWQFEASYNLPGNHLLTTNYSKAQVSSFFGDQLYYEYFAQLDVHHGDQVTVKYFGDYAKDISQQEKDRITLGALADFIWTDTRSVRLSYEWQRLYRLFSITRPQFTNMFGSAALYIAPNLSVGISVERSTDFLETDNADTPEFELDSKYWLGVFAGYQFLNRFNASLFAGTRRGGPACTAGTCYEVLDFRGMELRLTTRL